MIHVYPVMCVQKVMKHNSLLIRTPQDGMRLPQCRTAGSLESDQV